MRRLGRCDWPYETGERKIGVGTLFLLAHGQSIMSLTGRTALLVEVAALKMWLVKASIKGNHHMPANAHGVGEHACIERFRYNF